jgi:hypothetical protein
MAPNLPNVAKKWSCPDSPPPGVKFSIDQASTSCWYSAWPELGTGTVFEPQE